MASKILPLAFVACLVGAGAPGAPGAAASMLREPGEAAAGQPGTVYFLVSEIQPQHYDSYVLPLTDPQDIADARGLIKLGGGGRIGADSLTGGVAPQAAGGTIVVAHIAPGADGINGDYVEPGLRQWSWHVTDFHGFAFVTAEILDGWPGYVEQDVDRWIRNTRGTIGFWNYTVTRELTTVPEPAALATAFLAPAALLLRRRRRRPARDSAATGSTPPGTSA